MRPHVEIAQLRELLLRESYVLGITAIPGTVTFELDLVLTPGHAEYSQPKPGEQYCYRRGLLVAVTAAASAYQAWDTCTNSAKGSCGDAIVTAAIDTALALPGAGMGAAGRSLARSAAKNESALSRLLRNGVRDDRGSIGPFRKGTTKAGNRGARYSGEWYDSEDAARRAAEGYAAKHPSSCNFRGLCGAGDHYHVDKEINGFLVHTRHYYFPR